MKVTESNNNIYCNKKPHINNISRPQSFKGGQNFCIGVTDFIQKGGFAANFMVVDGGGCIVPRSVTGLYIGRDEKTKELNLKNATLEFLREVVTGPSMFVIPMGLLALTSKFAGSASKVTIKCIEDFCGIFKQNMSREVFYTEVFESVQKETMGASGDSNFAKKCAEYALEVQKSPEGTGNMFTRMFSKTKKDLKAEYDEKFELAQDFYIKNKKSFGNDEIKSHLNLKLSANNELSFEKLLSGMNDFYNDAQKNLKNGETDFFKKSRIGLRYCTNVGATLLVGGFMIIAPKLYNIFDVNPKTANLKKNAGGK